MSVSVPFQFSVAPKVTCRSTISTVTSVFPVTVNVRTSRSTSSTNAVKSTISPSSSSNVKSSGKTIVGSSLTGVTMISTTSVSVCPSSTVKVRVSVPYQFGIALKVTSLPTISTITLLLPETESTYGLLLGSVI